VSAAKIAEFAAALGDPNPAYSGEAPVAPPTFAAVIGAAAWDGLFADPELDLSLQRVVHADQSFVWHRPLRAGDTVTGALNIDKVRCRGAMEIVGVTVRVETLEGEPVVDSSSTFVHTSGDLMSIEVGTQIGELAISLTRAQLVRYAGASTDFNPIHWSDRAASALGLEGVIAHGMLTLGTALRVVTDWVGDPAAVRRYSARFTHPVVVPDDDEGGRGAVRGHGERRRGGQRHGDHRGHVRRPEGARRGDGRGVEEGTAVIGPNLINGPSGGETCEVVSSTYESAPAPEPASTRLADLTTLRGRRSCSAAGGGAYDRRAGRHRARRRLTGRARAPAR